MRYSVYGMLLFVLAFSAVWAYRINYDTREVLSQIQVIRAKIAFEEDFNFTKYINYAFAFSNSFN